MEQQPINTTGDGPKGASAGPGASSPRAPAMVIGYVFQSVGLIMFVSACCFWSLSTHFVPQADEPAERWMDHFRGEDLTTALLTIGVVTSVIGGLGLVGVGIGLQGERSGAGPAGMVATILMAVIFWVLVVALVRRVGWRAAVVPGVFACISSVLVFLAAHAASLLRRFPPPPDQNVVTDDFLREERARRRAAHDPEQ